MRLFKNMNSMRPLKPEEFNRNMKIIEDAFNGTDTWHELALIPAVALWASNSGIWYRRHAVGQLELRIDEFAGTHPSGISTVTIATLPEGYQPSVDQIQLAYNSGLPMNITAVGIMSNGNVVLYKQNGVGAYKLTSFFTTLPLT